MSDLSQQQEDPSKIKPLIIKTNGHTERRRPLSTNTTIQHNTVTLQLLIHGTTIQYIVYTAHSIVLSMYNI